MGEIVVDAELENPIDRGVFERGYGKESDIRRTSVRAVVDTGAVMLMLPQNVVERLGAALSGTVIVTYADERREERPTAGPFTLRLCNRSMPLDCVVGPATQRAADRPDRSGKTRPHCRLHQPYPHPAPRIAGLSVAQAEIAHADRRRQAAWRPKARAVAHEGLSSDALASGPVRRG